MRDKKLIVCSFSGGRTSAFLGRYLQLHEKYQDYDKLYIFANTGKEKQETLDFIQRCDQEWDLNIVWVEANIHKDKGKGTTYKIVDYNTACLEGSPFESMLKKYSLPTNLIGSHCTRELKKRPIDSYIKSLGYKYIEIAIGIRYDERHRIPKNRINKEISKSTTFVYPLCDEIKVDYKFIRSWWDRQCFDLQLKDYQGNCDLCFKKSLRKRLTLIKENDNSNWWEKMETKYATEGVPYFDMRQQLSIKKIKELAALPFASIHDSHSVDTGQAALFNLDAETDCFCKSS